jgi:hypothetical protein
MAIKEVPQGLSFHGNISFEEYQEFGEKKLIPYYRVSKSIPFWIGDFVIYGETHYGEMYAQALSVTDYAYETLKNCAYVCRNVAMEIRNPDLSWSHHYAVAKLEHKDQKELLEEAKKNNWTVSEIRTAAKALKEPEASPESVPPAERERFPDWFQGYCKEHSLNFNVDGEVHMKSAYMAGREDK